MVRNAYSHAQFCFGHLFSAFPVSFFRINCFGHKLPLSSPLFVLLSPDPNERSVDRVHPLCVHTSSSSSSKLPPVWPMVSRFNVDISQWRKRYCNLYLFVRFSAVFECRFRFVRPCPFLSFFLLRCASPVPRSFPFCHHEGRFRSL